MAKMKATGTNVPVPQDDSEAREAIREIGDLNRQALRLEAEMNDQIAALQQAYGEKVAPIRELAQAKRDGLQTFAEANRNRLTGGGKVKFARFATGEVSWRSRPAKVTIKKSEEEALVAALEAAGLGDRFLRRKVEFNREAMREDRATASAFKGVAIGSDGEDFIVEPFETELTEGVS